MYSGLMTNSQDVRQLYAEGLLASIDCVHLILGMYLDL